MTRLNEYTKAEWFDVARRLVPGITEEEFARQWDELMAAKAERARQRTRH